MTEDLSQAFELSQNWPNPFNTNTLIRYTIPEAGIVQIRIFDTLGREIKALVNEYQPSGSYELFWNGTDANNHPVSAGIYFYKIRTGIFEECKSMMLLR